MKKTHMPLTNNLTLIRVEKDNGEQLEFLNGVLQMNKKNRFVVVPEPLNYQYHLVIEDYSWWHDNHYDVTDWMRENLPRGEEHQKGMMLTFDSEQQRSWFLLRWS